MGPKLAVYNYVPQPNDPIVTELLAHAEDRLAPPAAGFGLLTAALISLGKTYGPVGATYICEGQVIAMARYLMSLPKEGDGDGTAG